MYYGVNDSIRYCVTGNAVILLDVRRNRYLGLPKSCAEAFIRLIERHGEALDGDDAKLAPLLKQGHLLPAAGPATMYQRPTVESPVSGLPLGGQLSVPPLMLVRAIWSQVAMTIRLKASSFATVVDYLATRTLACKTARQDEVDTRLCQVAAAFEQSDKILGRANRCLTRSFAMYVISRSLGIQTTVAIGVRAEPFAAHCWLQKAGFVLNDSIDNVRQFTPIFVLE